MSDAEHRAGHPGEPSGASGGATDAVPGLPSTAPSKTSDQMALRSLAPQYDEDQHKTYLDHLETAVEDPKNRNIALSGRYGTGKSSVLDKFQEKHGGSTLRLKAVP